MPVVPNLVKGAVKGTLFHHQSFSEKVQQRLSVVGDAINGLTENLKPRDEDANTPVGKCVQRVYDEASAQATKISKDLQTCFENEGTETADDYKGRATEIKDKLAANVDQTSKDISSGKHSFSEKAKNFVAEHTPEFPSGKESWKEQAKDFIAEHSPGSSGKEPLKKAKDTISEPSDRSSDGKESLQKAKDYVAENSPDVSSGKEPLKKAKDSATENSPEFYSGKETFSEKVKDFVAEHTPDFTPGKESFAEKAKEYIEELNPLKSKEEPGADNLGEGAKMVNEYLSGKNPNVMSEETTMEKMKRQASETLEGLGLPSLGTENMSSIPGSKSWLGMNKNEHEGSSFLGRLGRDFMVPTTLLTLLAAVIYLLRDRKRLRKLKDQAKPYVAKAKEKTKEAIDSAKETKDDAVNFISRNVHQTQAASQAKGVSSKPGNVEKLIDELRDEAEEKLKKKGLVPTAAQADISVKVRGTPSQ